MNHREPPPGHWTFSSARESPPGYAHKTQAPLGRVLNGSPLEIAVGAVCRTFHVQFQLEPTPPEEAPMRLTAALLAMSVLVACAPKEEAPPPPPPPAAPTLADFAGTWNVASMLEGTPDTVKSTMTGTADGAWTMSLEGRPNVPVTVSVVGDSLVGESAEYESILRKGVMVSVRTASVLMDGMLHGNLVATYKTPTGEQVVKGTMTGTKAP